ncbi:hypothetical protein LLS1_18720 [Leifsonia sp. LS1]|uniref:hypothetical protein n=1 Tax=Leifsonia sp. LS1 TaxID=2828483 RepID=UPI001CFF1FAE|nr:hypothetical protein [Leifsonia sp. LS1]GIT80203.1 hypothetical protein LLS1_18720 [Leifsonia sp. LS1]
MDLVAAPVHDNFEWWASIWIPALVGTATVLLAAAAVVTSVLAIRIARRSDQARLAEEQRASAREAAAALSRFVSLALSVQHTMTRRLNESPSAAEVERANAKADAEAATLTSPVPGARALFTLTISDLNNRWSDLPDSLVEDEESETMSERDNLRARLVNERTQRIRMRIGDWASNPLLTAPDLEKEASSLQE